METFLSELAVKLVHATEAWIFNSSTIFKEELALRNAIHLTKEGK